MKIINNLQKTFNLMDIQIYNRGLKYVNKLQRKLYKNIEILNFKLSFL